MHLSSQADFPAFVDLYIEHFGDCFSGEQGLPNLIHKRARPIFEGFMQERDSAFKLPKMAEMQPEVWEHLETDCWQSENM